MVAMPTDKLLAAYTQELRVTPCMGKPSICPCQLCRIARLIEHVDGDLDGDLQALDLKVDDNWLNMLALRAWLTTSRSN